MLYLSRLLLNDRSTETRRDLADCNRLHQRAMGAFPALGTAGPAREQLGVLYRLEMPDETGGGWWLLLQAAQAPDWATLPPGYTLRPPETKRVDAVYERIQAGMVLRFRLRANPTKRVGRRDDARWLGRRVALRGEDEQTAWLARKGEQHGFRLLPTPAGRVADVRTGFDADARGRHRAGPATVEVRADERLVFGAALFEGHLEVADAARFQAALRQGIGSGKAFGFGLLSVAGPAGR